MNSRIKSMRCLRCGKKLPIGDYLFGCPHCLEQGERSSVTFTYEGEAHIRTNEHGLYRYVEYLPYEIFPSIGEGETPLVELKRMARDLGCANIHCKNEFQNPSGSHKDRMNPFVVARAMDTKKTTISCASSGNEAASLALYAAAAGVTCCNVSSEDITPIWLAPSLASKASVTLTRTPEDRLAYLQEKIDCEDWYCVTNQLIPPVGSSCFGIQGYKTIAYELFEQMGESLADYIFVPTCRGDLLYGIFEGFQDLAAQRLISYIPHLVAVEPFARLEHVLSGADYKDIFAGSSELTPSIGGGTVTYQSLLALQESKGFAVSVSQEDVVDNIVSMAQYGLYLEASSAILYGALKKAIMERWVSSDSRIVLIATSHGFKNDPDYFERADFISLISRKK